MVSLTYEMRKTFPPKVQNILSMWFIYGIHARVAAVLIRPRAKSSLRLLTSPKTFKVIFLESIQMGVSQWCGRTIFLGTRITIAPIPVISLRPALLAPLDCWLCVIVCKNLFSGIKISWPLTVRRPITRHSSVPLLRSIVRSLLYKNLA